MITRGNVTDNHSMHATSSAATMPGAAYGSSGSVSRRLVSAGLFAAFAIVATGCGSGGNGPAMPRPIPSPVAVRQQPDGIALGDPTFEALPGARADFGRLSGAVYEIEVPDRWNG